MSEVTEKFPWKDGYWQPTWAKNRILTVKGSIVTDRHVAVVVQGCPHPAYPTFPGNWTMGDFGKASEKLMEKTGVCNYNMRMTLGVSETGDTAMLYGIMTVDSSTKGYFQLGTGKIGKLQWLNEDDMKMILGPVEHLDTRSHPYKIQPENQGRLIFLSGPPVCGKRMAGWKLAQKEGFVYYDGDLFIDLKNPYIPLNSERTRQEIHDSQPWVKGLSSQDIKTSQEAFRTLVQGMTKGKVTKQESMFPWFKLMAKDIASEKKKIGGDWVISSDYVPTRKFRDVIKKECNATFVVFTTSVTHYKERISTAQNEYKVDHLRDLHTFFLQWSLSVHGFYEPVQPDEKDAYELVINPEMQEDDLVQKVIHFINVTKPSGLDHLPPLPIRQPRESRLPKIQPTYLPSLVEARIPSARSIAAEVSYTV